MKVYDYFPYEKFRPYQKDVITQIIEALENDFKYIIVDAPTGFGKSAVVQTINDFLVNEYHHSSYILTATKNLQKQYWEQCKDDYHTDYRMVFGRSNYGCLVNGNSCDYGECKLSSANNKYKCMYGMVNGNPLKNGGCNYWKAKSENIQSETSIMNYNVLMTDLQYVRHYGGRSLMFCDEAHNIEHKIMNEVSIRFTERQMKKWFDISLTPLFNNTDIEFWKGFIHDLIQLSSDIIEKAETHYTDLTQDNVEKLKRFKDSLRRKLYQIKFGKTEWIVCPNEREKSIEIKPISIEGFVDQCLLDESNIVIFLSGSFIKVSQWAKELGLDDFPMEHIKTKSSFDMQTNNPIHRRWVGNMGMRYKSKTLPKMVKEVQKILHEHEGQCGIIHCHSKENAEYLLQNVPSGRLISYSTSAEKDKQLKIFEESNNLVMLGYSLEEGVDLPYDNIRFQIFLKTPYANLGDNQIRARMKKDKDWYQINTARKIVQAWGRGMRAEDDYCDNYLLDTGFNSIIKQWFMPDEFVEAIR